MHPAHARTCTHTHTHTHTRHDMTYHAHKHHTHTHTARAYTHRLRLKCKRHRRGHSTGVHNRHHTAIGSQGETKRGREPEGLRGVCGKVEFSRSVAVWETHPPVDVHPTHCTSQREAHPRRRRKEDGLRAPWAILAAPRSHLHAGERKAPLGEYRKCRRGRRRACAPCAQSERPGEERRGRERRWEDEGAARALPSNVVDCGCCPRGQMHDTMAQFGKLCAWRRRLAQLRACSPSSCERRWAEMGRGGRRGAEAELKEEGGGRRELSLCAFLPAR
jgi:hypothetical protein